MLMPLTDDEAIAAINARRDRDGPYRAELRPGTSPQWHLVKCAPGDENKVSAHFAGRGIGGYLPEFEVSYQRKGATLRARRLLFPGYIFVFVWDVKVHWRRIMACPGVVRIECVDEHPVVVPDDMIRRMQVIEALNGATLESLLKRGRGKRGRFDGTPKTVTISTKSYMDGITRLDAQGRIGRLHTALGLG